MNPQLRLGSPLQRPQLSAVNWTLRSDRYDRAVVASLVYQSEAFRQGAKDNPTMRRIQKALGHDFYVMFYKVLPHFLSRDVADDPPTTPLAKRLQPLIERVLADPETGVTRMVTVLQDVYAAVAAIGATIHFIEKALDDKQLRSVLLDKTNNDETRADALWQSPRLGRIVTEAVQAGQSRQQDARQAAMNWGIEPGDLQYLPPEQRIPLIEKLQRLSQLSQLVGRVRQIFTARFRRKKKTGQLRMELADLNLGADLAYALPTELISLSHPVMRTEFFRRFVEAGMQQYAFHAPETMGRGPLVVLLDKSSSMEEEQRMRMDWACAIACALVEAARRRHMPSAVIPFDADVHPPLLFAAKDRQYPQKLLDMARIMPSGGTNYRLALAAGRQIVETLKSLAAADLVIVTDGECRLEPTQHRDLRNWKAKTGCRILGVMVAAKDPFGGGLSQFCDKVFPVASLTSDGERVAGEIADAVH